MTKTYRYEVEDMDGNEVEYELPQINEVCPTCRGNGVAMAKSLREYAFTQSDFDEDPDLYEDVTSDRYDTTCDVCNGLRVVAEIDWGAAEEKYGKEAINFIQYCMNSEARMRADDEYTRRRENGGY